MEKSRCAICTRESPNHLTLCELRYSLFLIGYKCFKRVYDFVVPSHADKDEITDFKSKNITHAVVLKKYRHCTELWHVSQWVLEFTQELLCYIWVALFQQKLFSNRNKNYVHLTIFILTQKLKFSYFYSFCWKVQDQEVSLDMKITIRVTQTRKTSQNNAYKLLSFRASLRQCYAFIYRLETIKWPILFEIISFWNDFRRNSITLGLQSPMYLRPPIFLIVHFPNGPFWGWNFFPKRRRTTELPLSEKSKKIQWHNFTIDFGSDNLKLVYSFDKHSRAGWIKILSIIRLFLNLSCKRTFF